MEALASGLAGHEHNFYVYVNESSWLNVPGTGGVEYSNLNEGLPYWFNGLVPLAYTLDNERLKTQVHEVAGTVLGRQASDGWIGPEVGAERNFWARTPFFLGLTQLVEANKTWEEPVVTALRSFMTLTNTMLKNDSQGFSNCASDVDCSWGQARIHDLIITIQWMIEKYPSSQDHILWENMDMFYAQDEYPWDKWYTWGTFEPVVNDSDSTIFPYIHGVNVGQGEPSRHGVLEQATSDKCSIGLKASSVIYRINGTKSLVQKSIDAVDWTFKYHGSPSGTVLSDEEERDLAPYMGSELCTAVETTYSLSYMYQILGENEFADRAERTIFNAFPVMLTGDKWAHQYMDQPNQPWAVNTTNPNGTVPAMFTTANGGVATTYGMEPQYPCCTVNHPQGYPKFVANSWVAVGKDGLGHALLSPSTVTTSVNGGSVTISCDTTYPFGGTFTYSIHAQKSFDLYLRVPSWTKSFTVGSQSRQGSGKDGMHKISVKAGKSNIVYKLETGIRTEARSNNTVSVLYGNLLYALELGTSETSSYPHAYYAPDAPGISDLPYAQLRDYYINSTTPWNIAVDPSTLSYHGASGQSLPDPVFAQGAPPNFVTVEGCEIAWDLYLDLTPNWAPMSRKCTSSKKSYKLIPYGAAKVHMSELPVVKL